MIYILKAHVDYEGFRIMCATSTIPSMAEKIEKMISAGEQNFGEKCTIEIFNGMGTRIGEFELKHSEIPGKRIDWESWGSRDYLEPTIANYGKLAGILCERYHEVGKKFASSKNVVQ